MRVTPEERVYLQLLEGALQVSEYTDKLDITRGCLVVDLFCLISFASSLLPHSGSLFCCRSQSTRTRLISLGDGDGGILSRTQSGRRSGTFCSCSSGLPLLPTTSRCVCVCIHRPMKRPIKKTINRPIKRPANAAPRACRCCQPQAGVCIKKPIKRPIKRPANLFFFSTTSRGRSWCREATWRPTQRFSKGC